MESVSGAGSPQNDEEETLASLFSRTLSLQNSWQARIFASAQRVAIVGMPQIA